MNKLGLSLGKTIHQLRGPGLQALRDFLRFTFLIGSVHLLFRFWAYRLQYHILGMDFSPGIVNEWLVGIIVPASGWMTQHLFGIEHVVEGNTLWMNQHQAYVTVNEGCSGFKPLIQFFLLMLFFRGPWRHKVWFIPVGLLGVHLTNLFRISGLAWVAVFIPDQWHFLHDWFFRPLFYVVMFFLWVIWIERLASKPNQKPGGSGKTNTEPQASS